MGRVVTVVDVQVRVDLKRHAQVLQPGERGAKVSVATHVDERAVDVSAHARVQVQGHRCHLHYADSPEPVRPPFADCGDRATANARVNDTGPGNLDARLDNVSHRCYAHRLSRPGDFQ